MSRPSINWQSPGFYDTADLNRELERVFDICHGCRRCVNLCQAFPTLFDLVDASSTMEVDGVDPDDYTKVSDQCYLCDLCYMTKCPYIPPHEWAVDFPHLMLRAKAFKFKYQGAQLRDKLLTATGTVAKFAGIPIVRQVVNASTQHTSTRSLLGIHPKADLPYYQARSARKMLNTDPARCRRDNKVAIFSTCYSNRAASDQILDMAQVLEHNEIDAIALRQEDCCGMPKLELGDLETVAALKAKNVPRLKMLIEDGFDIIAPIPSCVLMFRQELPLLFTDDMDVKLISEHIFDPGEYLMLRHKQGALNTEFKNSLGTVMYHSACHARVQNFGLKTRDLLELVPDTQVKIIERCSGHDGTYGVKTETYDFSVKIARPAVRQLEQQKIDYFSGDCVLAGRHIAALAGREICFHHPISLLKSAYGI